jgi:hypothetical protein
VREEQEREREKTNKTHYPSRQYRVPPPAIPLHPPSLHPVQLSNCHHAKIVERRVGVSFRGFDEEGGSVLEEVEGGVHCCFVDGGGEENEGRRKE